MFAAFCKSVVLITGFVWIFLSWFLYFVGKPMVTWGTLLGCFLPAICFIIGFYIMQKNFDRPARPFLIAIFGGMFGRLIFIGSSLLFLIKMTEIDMTSLLVSLVGFYALYLGIELFFLNRRAPFMRGGKP